MRSFRRFRLSGALVLCAFLASEIAFLGFPRPVQPPNATDAPAAKLVSKSVEASQISTERVEERIEEHVSIPEILKRYGLPALFFHFMVWVSTLSACYLFLSINTGILELLPAELQQRISGGSQIGYAAAALGAAEVLGPARLALTVAAAPTASRVARQYDWFRKTEEEIVRFFSDATSSLSQMFLKA
ncbi:unnamed protein product [Durusdinium trenchii]|uniref:DUF1279 domain-containing protein n=1 Tax=Durusdinium trenchii TaxID=1381693 RepID=A0ABP0IJN7_9DINO